MIGTTQKAQSPAATGLSTDEKVNTDIIGQPDAIAKRETTLIANFALAGFARQTGVTR